MNLSSLTASLFSWANEANMSLIWHLTLFTGSLGKLFLSLRGNSSRCSWVIAGVGLIMKPFVVGWTRQIEEDCPGVRGKWLPSLGANSEEESWKDAFAIASVVELAAPWVSSHESFHYKGQVQKRRGPRLKLCRVLCYWGLNWKWGCCTEISERVNLWTSLCKFCRVTFCSWS